MTALQKTRKINEFDPRNLEEPLRTWGRWLRTNRPSGHCMSIEHRYKPPPCWYPEEPRYTIDLALAHKIEDICVGLPHKTKKLLKMRYVNQYNDWFIFSRLRVRDIEAEINRAKYLIWQYL